MRTEHIKKLESEIINFSERHGWEVIRGMNGSLMVSVFKRINNLLEI